MLHSSLALSLVTGRPFVIDKIRAGLTDRDTSWAGPRVAFIGPVLTIPPTTPLPTIHSVLNTLALSSSGLIQMLRNRTGLPWWSCRKSGPQPVLRILARILSVYAVFW